MRRLGSILNVARRAAAAANDRAEAPLAPRRKHDKSLAEHTEDLCELLALLEQALPAIPEEPVTRVRMRRARPRRALPTRPPSQVTRLVEFDERLPTDPARRQQEINGCKTLLLEIVRRAAHDWVLYRSSRRLLYRRLAENAYTWLFLEGPSHPDWAERDREEKQVTSFLGICESLDLDPDTVRANLRRLTPKSVMSTGRPAEYRKREAAAPTPAVVMLRDAAVDRAFSEAEGVGAGEEEGE